MFVSILRESGLEKALSTAFDVKIENARHSSWVSDFFAFRSDLEESQSTKLYQIDRVYCSKLAYSGSAAARKNTVG